MIDLRLKRLFSEGDSLVRTVRLLAYIATRLKRIKSGAIDSATLLRNGSARIGRFPQLLQPNQQGKRALELPVKVHLVTAEPLQPVGVD
jgi:hypothetical protein